MRLNTTLFTVGVLLGTALADFKTIKGSMRDVKNKTNDLAEAIKVWPGTASSGGEMLCKTVALRKSLDACVGAFKQTPEPLKDSDMRNMPIVPLVFAMFKLENQTLKAAKRLNNVGVNGILVEIIKAQKAPTSDMFKAMKVIMDKLPPGFKNEKPFGHQTYSEIAQKFVDNEIDEFLEKLQPQSKPPLLPQELVTPVVLMAARFSKSIDTDPFCKSIPNLMNTLARKKTKVGTITNTTLEVLKSSRVQNVSPLDVLKKGAKAAGMPPNVIPNVLKQNGFLQKPLPVREFIDMVPGLLSTNLRTFNKMARELLDLSRVQDVVIPLEVMKKGAKAAGMGPNVIPNVLKQNGFLQKPLHVREFTNMVPKLLDIKVNNKALGDVVLEDIVLDTPLIISFADSVAKTVLGSAPR
ncbi:hypothetical protein C2857_000215 [Epichloe festucae Fl1]|uniref:Uncharacterized protein n=1 Tax=Epichloe festucae (strain Fl1) TaxID=877507 RepID=A0A7S9KJN1_EPIFF|nr:hypothetical protein C2857_000215 [Epichloe festucae Fl1]